MNTIITEKTSDGEVSYDVFSKLVDNRILFLYDYIKDDVAADAVATLLYLDHQDDKKKISLYINSYGGDINSIFMIYDVMKMVSSPIETLCVGGAEGESVLILAAGTKGMRHATKSATFKINQLVPNYASHADMIKAEILHKHNKKSNENFLKCLSECTGKSIKKIVKDTEREFYQNSTEAKKYGIIDSIIGEQHEIKKTK